MSEAGVLEQTAPAVLTGEHFWNGDVAAAEGGLAAGCRFFGGYPITPATEVAERCCERLPEVGGIYIQMEDEIASMAAIIGAAWGGLKTMTSTSGPGFSLMMENLGLAIMMEIPTVLVNVQRGGPSTGFPTAVGQQDMMQARFGSHGDYEIIALAPQSPQECFDLTLHAFNLAEKYRTPVLVMTDEVVGHMSEKVVVPPADQIYVEPRRFTKKPPSEYLPYAVGEDLIPEIIKAGDGYLIHTTGLMHDERGYPDMRAECGRYLVPRLVEKIRKHRFDIYRYEEIDVEDADVVIVSYGITSRVSDLVRDMLRAEGVKVGTLRLIVAWPFPEERIAELSSKVAAFVVPEVNMGQMVREVQRACEGRAKAISVPLPGGAVPTPEEIIEAVQKAMP